ncbi:hypothetical protein BMG03_01005 [Thioclava nitratireducens]|uniref:Uncharacterized protein n=1 Tax=Thioclava nitratireducens TaxID=1915078 RepID=A0ABM6ICY5_9RHOB|nr:hypothetical protein [Thioclava nitratireducens]AQS46534.1 hypothetical protein BMG03_01005 [Thioclava nitratireducens]
MPKPNNQWEREAREMAERIERQREIGEQLTFLPDEQPESESGAGRPKGAKNKASTQLRDWLAAQGLRMPEDVLTEIAGLRSRDDAITLAMVRTERILDFAADGMLTKISANEPKLAWAIAAKRLEVFTQQYTIILRALEAVMPYTAAKATPDIALTQNVTQINVPAPSQAPRRGGDDARDITAKPRRIGPPPMPHEMQRKQQVTKPGNGSSDGEDRTE